MKKNKAQRLRNKPTLAKDKILILQVPVKVTNTCGTVDSPKEFFSKLTPYIIQWLTWASEIDSCWDNTCGTDEFRKQLQQLCKEFAKWAKDAQDWGDEVEDCFQTQCPQPPDHTTPPPPPFD